VAKYQQSSTRRATWQVADTLLPYAAVWLLIALLEDISLWLTVPLVVLGGGLLVRMFIIFHDCVTAHSSGRNEQTMCWDRSPGC